MEKQFREAYGISIMRYCAERRMARATELLKTESVTRVSEALSFSSINAFSRAFKTACGISPADFKRRMRKK